MKTELLIKKAPLLMVLNAKGGVGKTAIALNTALSFDYGFMTNDRLSIVEQVLDDEHYMIMDQTKKLPDIPDGWPIVYDFGGYSDERASEVMENVQYILIPILPYREDIQATLNFIHEIVEKKAQERILIIINQTSGDQYEVIKEAVHKYFPDIKTFNLKKTSAFAWMVEHKKSLRELSRTFKQYRRYFKPAADQFDKIFEYIIERN